VRFGAARALFEDRMATMTSSPPVASTATGSPANGVRWAAILLTSIGDEACAAVLRNLKEDQVHQVTREISRLETVSDDERTSVMETFMGAAERGRIFDPGGIEYATSVLVAAFGPETGKRMAERVVKSLGTEMASIDSLQKADPQQLAKVVHREHPQTIALVLAHIGLSHAAKLLAALPPKLRADIVRRMAVLDQISPEVVNKIAKTLGAKLRLLGESSMESYGGVRAVAEVLNRVDASTSEGILSEISEDDPNLGQTIRNLMFVFEDLVHLDTATIRTLLGRVDRKSLTVALKGCSAQVRSHFTSAMSSHAADMLLEDMQALGPVRIREVEEAQQAIIANARRLETEGVLSLKPGSGDEMVL
jgi:flagellar motor switch protein FliG